MIQPINYVNSTFNKLVTESKSIELVIVILKNLLFLSQRLTMIGVSKNHHWYFEELYFSEYKNDMIVINS